MPAIQIAVTGSQGKTNTARMIGETLKTIGKTVVTDIDLDTVYNVPITALKIAPWTDFAVFELGIDHQKEMNLHLQIVKPKIAIVTGISSVHTDKEHLGSLENLIFEKRKLLEALPKDGYAILNFDDEHVRQMSQYTKAHIFWYGSDLYKCQVSADPQSIKLSLSGTSFQLTIGKTHRFIHTSIRGEPELLNHIPISTALLGKHHAYTVMATILTIQALEHVLKKNISFNRVLKEIHDMKPLPGRMSVEKSEKGYIFLNDSLRANPASTASGILSLSELEHIAGRKIAILAEMGELENPEDEHRKIGQLVALEMKEKKSIDLLISIGPHQKLVIEEVEREFRALQSENPPQAFWTENVIEAARILKKFLNPGDVIYLKGSLLRHIERIPLILSGITVGCNVTLCPFYHNCNECIYRVSGYQHELKKEK